MTKILCIVPRLPPSIDGLGDYAVNLTTKLQFHSGIQTTFIVTDGQWTGPQQVAGCPVIRLPEPSQQALYETLQQLGSFSSTVWLNYVPHAYAKRACPHWLIQGLEQWKREQRSARLITMFHELYAFGLPVWNMTMPLERTGIKIVASSDFWLSPIQQYLMGRLAKLSDRCLTNRQGNAEILQKIVPTVAALPVISNVGELDQQEVYPLAKRQRRLVIFGQSRVKARAYQQSLQEIQTACQMLDIEEVVDIGPTTGLNLTRIGSVPLIEMGKQDSSRISELLRQSFAGFLNYPISFLGRSGIFAAYCAHGLLPVLHPSRSVEMDGLVAGQHYLQPSQIQQISPSSLQAIATAALHWYSQHCLARQADLLTTFLLD